jgi:hypothetical protein
MKSMSASKFEAPAVVTYSDHEIISPPNKLRDTVSEVPFIDPDDDPVARAEQALSELSSEFSQWMIDECERLDQSRHRVKTAGFIPTTHTALYQVSHDIKGEAVTFGYPAAATIADSLCRLLEHTPEMARIPISLVDQHVDAIRAVVREHARSDADEVAAELIQRLRDVTEDFLVYENRHRPEYLERISAPSLAPEEIAP